MVATVADIPLTASTEVGIDMSVNKVFNRRNWHKQKYWRCAKRVSHLKMCNAQLNNLLSACRRSVCGNGEWQVPKVGLLPISSHVKGQRPVSPTWVLQ